MASRLAFGFWGALVAFRPAHGPRSRSSRTSGASDSQTVTPERLRARLSGVGMVSTGGTERLPTTGASAPIRSTFVGWSVTQ